MFVLFLCLLFVRTNGIVSQESPKLIPLSPTTLLSEGSQWRVFCSSSAGDRPLLFQWAKDGHVLPNSLDSAKYKIENAESFSVLIINNLSHSDSGNYSCIVRNAYSEDMKHSQLIVKGVGHQSPPYFRASVVIPVTVAIVVIVIACTAAYVYIKYEERNAVLAKMAILSAVPSKNFQYISAASPQHIAGSQSVVSEEETLSFRYSDASDKSKPVFARPPMPSMLWAREESISEENEDNPYASLPFQKGMTSFNAPQPPRPPLPPNHPSKHNTRFDNGLLCHTPPQTRSSFVFCKVDVHNQDNIDELCRPHHV